MKKVLGYILILIVYCQCTSENNSINYYSSIVGIKEFELDSLTPNYVHHMQLVEENGENHLYLLSPYNNRFLVYDFNDSRFIEEFRFENEEMNNIKIGSYYLGFYIHNKDSIFLLSTISKLFLGNKGGDYTLLFDFVKHTDDRDFWLKFTQINKPIMLNDSIIKFGGMYQRNTLAHIEGAKTDMDFNFKTNTFNLVTTLPKGIYTVGNYYFPDRVRPSRVYSKKYGKVFYSFPNADSIYVKDLVDDKDTLKGIFAKENNLQPFIEIDNLDGFTDVLSNGSRVYQTQQGAYNSLFLNDNKDLLIRTAYLGIKDYDPKEHVTNGYTINKAIMFFDLKDYSHLKTIYLKNIDERFMFFDEDYFYVYSFDSQKDEDKIIFDKYAYPEFD